MYGFNQALINVMTLCTFFSTKFMISCFFYISFVHNIYFLNYASWLQVFQLFKFSTFQVKIVNHCESYVSFQDIEI